MRPPTSAAPSDDDLAANERPSASSSGRQTPNDDRRDERPTRRRSGQRDEAISAPSSRPSRRRSSTSSAAVPAMLHDGGRERDPPGAEAVEGDVEHRVQGEVPERDDRRDPVRLQAEERAVQHQHRAVEDEPGAERGERARDDGRLVGGATAPRWKRDADDRLGEHGADDGAPGRAGTRSAAGRVDDRARGSRPCRRGRRAARATGRAPSRPRPRTSPAGACRRGTPSRSPSARASGRCSRDAKNVSMTALTLIRPRPSVTGQHQLEDAPAPPGRASRARAAAAPSRPRSHGIGRSTWITVRDQDRAGVDVELRARSPSACGTPITSPTMIARFQNTGESAGTVNWS